MPLLAAPSPYEAVLGDRLGELHPRLRAYFSAIPAGDHGAGTGVFDAVGTSRRWLWPVLAVLALDGVLFPVWQHGVPFIVTNAPDPSGRPAVTAVRTFQFARGSRWMVDEISAEAGVLVDRLGNSRRLVTTFDAAVDGGALRLSSTRVGIRVASRTAWLPRWCAPTVSLEERFDDDADCQRVSVVVGHPLLGRLYEYAGSFRYELRQGEAPA